MKISIRSITLLILTAAIVIAVFGCEKEPQDTQPASPPKVDKPAITTPDPVVKSTETVVKKEVTAVEVTETTEPKDEKPPVVDSQQADIVPMVGAGPITFGMSKEQVIAALGEPDLIEGGGIAIYYPKEKGLSFFLDRTKGVREINCWSDLYPIPFPDGMTTFPGKTKEGIGMNANREEIIAAYGEPDSITSKGPIEFLDYATLKMQFSIVDNKLVSLKLRGG